jgi:hypothetical protein
MSKSHTSATGYNERRNAVMASNEYDPLKLYYLVILGTDAPTDVTPFQGFSTSWRMVSWALEMLTILPADVLERSYAIDDAISQRMGGLRPLSWVPFNVSALEAVTAEELGVFIVLVLRRESSHSPSGAARSPSLEPRSMNCDALCNLSGPG